MRISNFVLVLALTVLSSLQWAPQAMAQTENDARVMFEEGNTYLQRATRTQGTAQRQALREALSLYHRALQITRSRSVIFNVALCYEMLERYDDAFSYYSEYLGFDDLAEDDRALAQQRLEGIRPNVALIEVTSSPTGATIYIDRTDLPPRSLTPSTVAITPGEHRIILDLENYRRAEAEVEALLGQTREVSLSLGALPARVRFETDPPGAEIRLDSESSEPLGTTPLTIDVPAGSHRVYAALGDRSGREIIDAPAGGSQTVAVVLGAPTTPALVHVNVDTSLAGVTVDGRVVGNAPIRRLRLAPGRHRITVDAGDEYEIWSDVIEVTPGANLTMNVHLATTEPQRRFGVWPNMGMILAGMLGVAAAATGGWALSLHADFENIEAACDANLGGSPRDCAEGTALRQEALGLDERIRPLAVATDVLWITAAVLGLTSMTLMILNREVEDATTVRLGAAPTPGGVFASISIGPIMTVSP